jgi:hypothetical protein
MTEHIPNSQLILGRVPAPAADFAESTFPFAMTFHAYEVWGDVEIVRDVAERTWAARAAMGSLPQSLTRLRWTPVSSDRSRFCC